MSNSPVPQLHIITSLSKKDPQSRFWELSYSVSPDQVQKTEEGLHIVVSNSLPDGQNPDEWPMTTIEFTKPDMAERILMPYEGSYDFLAEPMPIPAGSSLTFEVKAIIDPSHVENEWQLGVSLGATAPTLITQNACDILIQC